VQLSAKGKGQQKSLTEYLDEQKRRVEAIEHGEGIQAFRIVAPRADTATVRLISAVGLAHRAVHLALLLAGADGLGAVIKEPEARLLDLWMLVQRRPRGLQRHLRRLLERVALTREPGRPPRSATARRGAVRSLSSR
jgi:hypothetical protein